MRPSQPGPAALIILSSRAPLGLALTHLHPYAKFMFTEIDAWIGKTLFVPPIIRFCQMTRQSQFAVSKLFWFVAALSAFYHAKGWFDAVLWGTLSIWMLVTAGHRADRPTVSFKLVRMLAVAMLIFDLVRALVLDEWEGAEFWLLVLIAEYAATISTIPPRASSKHIDVNASGSAERR